MLVTVEDMAGRVLAQGEGATCALTCPRRSRRIRHPTYLCRAVLRGDGEGA